MKRKGDKGPAMKRLVLAALCAIHLLGCAGTVRAEQEQLVLMFNDLEPFVVRRGGQVSGFLGEYLTRVLREAQVQALWKNVPWDKQLPTMQQNPVNVCVVAVFKTPERETYLKYSAPIGFDYGFVLVGRRGHKGLLGHTRFKDVVSDPDLNAILQKQTVYSAYINGLITNRDFRKTSGSMERMIRSLEAGHYDYLIALQSRAKDLLERGNLTDTFALYSHYTDLGEPIAYHVGCSLATDQALFDRFNGILTEHGPVARPD